MTAEIQQRREAKAQAATESASVLAPGSLMDMDLSALATLEGTVAADPSSSSSSAAAAAAAGSVEAATPDQDTTMSPAASDDTTEGRRRKKKKGSGGKGNIKRLRLTLGVVHIDGWWS